MPGCYTGHSTAWNVSIYDQDDNFIFKFADYCLLGYDTEQADAQYADINRPKQFIEFEHRIAKIKISGKNQNNNSASTLKIISIEDDGEHQIRLHFATQISENDIRRLQHRGPPHGKF
jgi:hypothetical protein